MPSDNTLSPINVDAVAAWLDLCLQSHEKCRSKAPSRLPTRVIDVGPFDGSQDPKLIITDGETSPYVALSHCWGKPSEFDGLKNARTLSTNLKDLLLSIPMDTVSQNVQDAIVTVRNLGLRYLWVDALCIIQDNHRDWEVEASRMGDIYSSAYLTIAATSAASGMDGFLARARWPWPVVSMPCITKESATRPVELYVRYEPYYWRGKSVEDSVWNSRGWTLQERLLASRVLHFASDGLRWECRTGEGSEENRETHLPRESNHPTPWMTSDLSTAQSLSFAPDIASFDNRYERWYQIASM